MEGVQIRALIGKGGETIKEIRLRSGADIKIDHLPSDPQVLHDACHYLDGTTSTLKMHFCFAGPAKMVNPKRAFSFAGSLGKWVGVSRVWRSHIAGS
ncbi:unnamed protein product [Effrenium voratum]|uniref:K Homology domain-containing protein n=1 Tax=Effrenium voratum TaxID=2562239 RepID=A0AA36NJW6_9DINO|nr:unnamed protein product [Effrenium voratum]